jgi:RNA polymerase sigma-70 factor, ECF subfamily
MIPPGSKSSAFATINIDCQTDGPTIATTSPSLLERLQAPDAPDADWRRLHDIYVPLLRHWLGKLGVAADDVDDLAQDIWVIVLKKLPAFERRRNGSFRAWLRQLAINLVRNWRRKYRPAQPNDILAQLEDPNSDLSRQWDRDHDRRVFDKLLDVARPDFAPATWNAFRRFTLDGVPAAQVAVEFQLSEAAVLQAKSRILKRLREEAAGLIE